MKNYINKIFGCAILASATMLASCGSDYLETKPTSSVGSENAVATTEMAYMALNGIARCQTTQHYAFTQGFAGENAIMRLYRELAKPENSDLMPMHLVRTLSHNQQFHNRTNTIYDGYTGIIIKLIGQANTIIARIDAAAAGNESDKKFIKASPWLCVFTAREVDSLLLLSLRRLTISAPGVDLLSSSIIRRCSITTLAETVDQIYKDCQEAITLFGESGIDQSLLLRFGFLMQTLLMQIIVQLCSARITDSS